MAANVEIKARVRDLAAAESVARRLASGPPEALRQEDVFFACGSGRLKLRIFPGGRGELIAYERADSSGPRLSSYSICAVKDPAALRNVLSRALGERAVVRKERCLYMVGQTRVHLDRVEGLGDFLELEVVLHEGQDPAAGQGIAQDLMEAFGIAPGDLVPVAYADLLAEGRKV